MDRGGQAAGGVLNADRPFAAGLDLAAHLDQVLGETEIRECTRNPVHRVALGDAGKVQFDARDLPPKGRLSVRPLQGQQLAPNACAGSFHVRGIGSGGPRIAAWAETVEVKQRPDGDVERPAGFVVDPEGCRQDQRQRVRDRLGIRGLGRVQMGEFGVVAPVGHAAVHGVEFGLDGRPDGLGVGLRTADAGGPAGPEGFTVEGPRGVGGWGAGRGDRGERE